MICYYHKVDLDGKCSAAIVKRKYPDCKLIGVDYPDRPDFETIKIDETVFVVDFSFTPQDMDELREICGQNFIWIDHHKSAIKAISEYKSCYCSFPIDSIMKGKREIGKAGCELTWEYLFPDEDMPEGVKLLGRYDVGDKSNQDERENKILPFQYGMRSRGECVPTWDIWELLLQPYYTVRSNSAPIFGSILKDGEIIFKYEVLQNISYAKAMAFTVEFEGHKAWAINKALSDSSIFDSLDTLDRPLSILFSCRAGVWRYSLRSESLDVSEIAAKHGGGGHAGAAGFKSNQYLLTECGD